MRVEEWRTQIDEIDRKVATLLNDRARCVIEVGKIKKQHGASIFDSDRERQVMLNVLQQNRGPLDENALRRIFERIIDEFRRIEHL